MLQNNDGTMEQGKQDDTADREEAGPPRIREYIFGKVERAGDVVEYSYNVVYSQESIRVYDLRLNTADPEYTVKLRRILRRRATGLGEISGYVGVEIDIDI